MNFGYTVDESSSFVVMDAAVDAGINFLDTADVYGGPQSPDMKQGYRIAEQTVGRWLQRSGHRDDIVLATKVYQPMGLGPNDHRLSAYHIRRAYEASLRRLQTDHMDLYQMHHVDRATPWEEVWQAMEQLVREGKVIYVGSSNLAAWDVALAQASASARHFLGLTCEQSLYDLAVRAVELELIPALRALGVGLIPYSPLHAGLLAGALESGSQDRRVERHRDQRQAYEGLCRELGAKPADVALAWLLRNPVVSTTVVGAMTIEELQADLGALSVQLDDRGGGTTRPDLARTGGSTTGVRPVRQASQPVDPAAGKYGSDGPGAPVVPPDTHERPSTSVARQRHSSTRRGTRGP